MSDLELEAKLQRITTALVNELIMLTPETMSEIQFEIVGTPDGGADVGLIENHPDVQKVALSDTIYAFASRYLPLVKQYVPGWQRTLIQLREDRDGWKVAVDFQRDQ